MSLFIFYFSDTHLFPAFHLMTCGYIPDSLHNAHPVLLSIALFGAESRSCDTTSFKTWQAIALIYARLTFNCATAAQVKKWKILLSQFPQWTSAKCDWAVLLLFWRNKSKMNLRRYCAFLVIAFWNVKSRKLNKISSLARHDWICRP